MVRIAACLLAVAACGRVGFDAPPGSSGDAGGLDALDASPLRCIDWQPFGTPVDIAITAASANWLGSVTRDELTVLFADYKTQTKNDLWIATRPDRDSLFSAAMPIAELNTTEIEFDPVSADGLSLMYRSLLTGGGDILATSRSSPSSTFDPPVPVTELNSTADDSPGPLSGDGLRIYFTSARTTQGAIFIAERPDPSQPFSAPTLLAELDSPASDDHPTLTADELEIFFASKRSGGRYDIWWARRDSRDAPFDPPVAVTELNTVEDETLPVISPDGSRLYFNYQTRLEGGLPSHLYVAERTCAMYGP